MSRRVIELREYESREVELPADTARSLQSAAGSALDVRIGATPARWVVTARGHIGAIVLPEVDVLITPKVDLENVFVLLDVGLPASAWSKQSFSFGTNRHLLAAVAAFYSRAVDHAVGGGLLRTYVVQRERVVAVRGRLDMRALTAQPGILSPIACEYDDYTADNAENRLLKSAVRRLLALPGVLPETRRQLLRALTSFEEVAEVPVDPDEVLRRPFNRLNKHYEPALRLARLILRNATLRDAPGGAAASAFLLDMPDLFQRWVTDRLRRSLRGVMSVVSEPREPLGEGNKVPMYPDLVFEREELPVYVGDVKYKLASDGFARASDYYQLLAYATVLQQAEGVLIYCQAEGATPEKAIDVRRVGTRLWTYRLPLAGAPSDVEASVAKLAGWLRERTEEAA